MKNISSRLFDSTICLNFKSSYCHYFIIFLLITKMINFESFCAIYLIDFGDKLLLWCMVIMTSYINLICRRTSFEEMIHHQWICLSYQFWSQFYWHLMSKYIEADSANYNLFYKRILHAFCTFVVICTRYY